MDGWRTRGALRGHKRRKKWVHIGDTGLKLAPGNHFYVGISRNPPRAPGWAHNLPLTTHPNALTVPARGLSVRLSRGGIHVFGSAGSRAFLSHGFGAPTARVRTDTSNV